MYVRDFHIGPLIVLVLVLVLPSLEYEEAQALVLKVDLPSPSLLNTLAFYYIYSSAFVFILIS